MNRSARFFSIALTCSVLAFVLFVLAFAGVGRIFYLLFLLLMAMAVWCYLVSIRARRVR